MKTLLMAAFLLLPFVAAQAGMIENGDFSAGRDRWSGGGTVIELNDSGNPVAEGEAVTGHALEITLHASDWSYVEQRLNMARTPEETKALLFTFQLQALPDYAPLADSPAYSKDPDILDWLTTNWYYGCRGEVYPKAGFVVRLSDAMRADANYADFRYAPRTIANDGAWKTIKMQFQGLKLKDHTLRILFPPGTGTIRIRNIVQVVQE